MVLRDGRALRKERNKNKNKNKKRMLKLLMGVMLCHVVSCQCKIGCPLPHVRANYGRGGGRRVDDDDDDGCRLGGFTFR